MKDWSSTFTADIAGLIVRRPLPSGTWTVNGASTWTRGERSYALAVSTDPAVHYDASCDEAPRFDSGKVTLVVTRGGDTSTVTIGFTRCGRYTVTKS